MHQLLLPVLCRRPHPCPTSCFPAQPPLTSAYKPAPVLTARTAQQSSCRTPSRTSADRGTYTCQAVGTTGQQLPLGMNHVTCPKDNPCWLPGREVSPLRLTSPHLCQSFEVEEGHSLMQFLVLSTQTYGKGAGVRSAAHNSNKTTLGNFIVET